MRPSLRLVQPRIEEELLLIQTAREARAKAESAAEHPMLPTRAERLASDRLAYWERYLRRPTRPLAIPAQAVVA